MRSTISCTVQSQSYRRIKCTRLHGMGSALWTFDFSNFTTTILQQCRTGWRSETLRRLENPSTISRAVSSWSNPEPSTTNMMFISFSGTSLTEIWDWWYSSSWMGERKKVCVWSLIRLFLFVVARDQECCHRSATEGSNSEERTVFERWTLNETCTVPRIIQASLYLHSLLRLAWTVSEVVVAGAGDDMGGGGGGQDEGEGVFLVFYQLLWTCMNFWLRSFQ